MLKTYISWLSVQNKKLSKEYPRVRFSQIIVPSLLCALDLSLIIAIIGFESVNAYISSRSILLISTLTIYIIIALISKKICQPIICKYRDLYKRAQKISDAIVDEADWTNFRKRALWNNRRIQVISTIDEFHSIRNKRFFPYPSFHSYYTYIQSLIIGANTICWIEMFCLTIFSLDPESYFAIKELLHKLLFFLN